MKSNRQTKWIKGTGATFMIIALLAIAPQSSAAQGQEVQKATPNLQELREKLLQLEQTMRELKEQINAAEQSHKTSDAPINETASIASGEAPNTKLQKTPGLPIVSLISRLASANSAQADAGTTPVNAAPKPPQLMPTPKAPSENSLDIYGFVMFEMGYQFKTNDPLWFDVLRPVKLPSFPGEFAPDGKLWSGVRQTRFGVKTSTPTSLGPLTTIFEWELFGTGVDAGQTTFRLRHAYGELGQFGAGQYWSPFMDIDVFPNSIEYWGPNGMVFFRNVQVRWMPVKGDSRVTIALERPGASADQGDYANRIELQGVRPKFEFPDLSWEARLGRKWGYVELAGIFRQIKWVDTNNDQFDLGDSVLGWGLNLSSNLKFGSNDVGKLQVVYGKGIQNYMNDAPQDVGIKNNFLDPVKPIRGVALPLVGVVAFLDHTWSERFTSTIGYSLLDIKNSDGQAANAFHQGHYALTNLLWYPTENYMIGAEFQFGRRLNARDGFNVNDYRLQFSFKYDYSKGFKF